jgi:predicted small lipoprotein YifL
MRIVLALAITLGLLVACGKKGPPTPPGPADKVIYPKTYPTH